MTLFEPPGDFKLSRIIHIFHQAFSQEENVCLKGGFSEPFYRSAVENQPAEIRFTRDYLNSCLHEIAHWCIAGKARRQQDDYGYWYQPDGRNGEGQKAFFKVESSPQALEWAFALASREHFRPSCDNLAGGVIGDLEFTETLKLKMAFFIQTGFPPRGRKFIQELMAYFYPEIESKHISTWLYHNLFLETD